MTRQPQPNSERLYALLCQEGELAQQAAAERLELTARQVRRLVEQLQEQGISVQEAFKNRRRVYRLAPKDRTLSGERWSGNGSTRTHDAPPPDLLSQLTENELLALTVAVESARASLRPTPLHEPLDRVRQALAHRLTPHVFIFDANSASTHWHFSEAPSVDLDPTVFYTLRESLHERRSVRIDYTTASTGEKSTGRKVNPYLLAVRGGSWLCVAYCHQRESLRDFALAGISAIELCDPDQETNTHYTIAEDFDPELYFKGRFNALAGKEEYVVRLRVEPDRASYFRRKDYHPTQIIDEEHDDGGLIVSYEVAGLKEIAAWVRSWGPGVTVLEPRELADQVITDAKETLAKYTSLRV